MSFPTLSRSIPHRNTLWGTKWGTRNRPSWPAGIGSSPLPHKNPGTDTQTHGRGCFCASSPDRRASRVVWNHCRSTHESLYLDSCGEVGNAPGQPATRPGFRFPTRFPTAILQWGSGETDRCISTRRRTPRCSPERRDGDRMTPVNPVVPRVHPEGGG